MQNAEFTTPRHTETVRSTAAGLAGGFGARRQACPPPQLQRRRMPRCLSGTSSLHDVSSPVQRNFLHSLQIDARLVVIEDGSQLVVPRHCQVTLRLEDEEVR